VVASLVLAAGACTSPADPDAGRAPDPDVVVVGSFDFPESELLAEIYAQALERSGLEVERHLGIGPREIAAPAIAQDRIDLLPEYLASAVQFVGLDAEQSDDPAVLLGRLRAAAGKHGVTVLEPSAAVDRNALAMRADVAQRLGIETVEQLRDHDRLRFVGPPECPERPACLPRLEELGIEFHDVTALPAGDPIALALDAGEADVGLAFSTDPSVLTHGLVLLDGSGGFDRAEHVVPLVRSEVIERHGPKVAAALNRVSSRLSTTGLAIVNGKVARGESVAHVAREWLDSHT
jgi:osmoprotectant transport system substrate-binding protein